jgi:predicted CXXCH cytochrome family protein
VSANACRSCHRQHTAAGKERLMIFEEEEENCLVCHDGQIARSNILAELNKLSGHDPRLYLGVHDPAEIGPGSQLHVECSDCHNPHAVVGEPRRIPNATIGATMYKVPGLTIGGASVAEAQHEYEVCFRCHVETRTRTGSHVARDNEISNFVLKFLPSNASYHPVVMSSPSRDTISLVSGLAPGSIIRCTDCHNNNDGPASGGSGPDGPHGSDYEFLLERNYTVQDETPESEYEYALCYKCHERSSILSDQSFPLHRLHIVEENTPCSACHDPHGVSRTQRTGSDQTHLINFATRIVRPERTTGRLRFQDLGVYAGSCTLSCHGVDHMNSEYGSSGVPMIINP